jgi:hypothetical protein
MYISYTALADGFSDLLPFAMSWPRPNMLAFMNQVQIWRSHLVRKLLKRGNFLSLHDLRGQMLAFLTYYHQTMAKPIKWTDTGQASSWRDVPLSVLAMIVFFNYLREAQR